MAAQTIGILHLQRRPPGEENLLLLHLEAVPEILGKMAADGLVQLQTHYRQTAALLEQLFHLLAEIHLPVKGFIIRVDIRIAGDAKHYLLQHVIHAENVIGVFIEHGLHRHIAPLVPGQEDQGRQGGRHRKQPEGFPLFPGKQHTDMKHFPLNMGKGMVGIHNLRGQHRLNHIFEVVLDIFLFLRCQITDRQAVQPFPLQAALYIGVGAVPAAVEGRHCRIDLLQLLAGGETGFVVYRLLLHHRQIPQAPHPDHKKLIQVTGKDRQELQPLQQGDGFVLRLLQYSGIKLQPGELSILGKSLFPNFIRHDCISFHHILGYGGASLLNIGLLYWQLPLESIAFFRKYRSFYYISLFSTGYYPHNVKSM